MQGRAMSHPTTPSPWSIGWRIMPKSSPSRGVLSQARGGAGAEAEARAEGQTL